MKRHIWTDQERAIVARNQRARVPLAETARQLGRGYAGVKSFASDAGHLQPRRSLTAEQRAQAFSMRDQGRTSATRRPAARRGRGHVELPKRKAQ